MNIKQTIIALALLIGFGSFLINPLVSAVDEPNCGGVNTSIINCKDVDNSKVETSAIWKLLIMVLNILTAGIGVAGVGGILYGSIMYTTAGGSVDKVKQARGIIANTVIGLVAYALMYSLLNWLIPGGLFA